MNVAINFPTKPHTYISTCRNAVFFVAAGNSSGNDPSAMTLDTQMSLAKLQELLLALRANKTEAFKGWLALGLEELGGQVAMELTQGWMSPLLTEIERDQIVG